MRELCCVLRSINTAKEWDYEWETDGVKSGLSPADFKTKKRGTVRTKMVSVNPPTVLPHLKVPSWASSGIILLLVCASRIYRCTVLS